jgi:hypothetical protein
MISDTYTIFINPYSLGQSKTRSARRAETQRGIARGNNDLAILVVDDPNEVFTQAFAAGRFRLHWRLRAYGR